MTSRRERIKLRKREKKVDETCIKKEKEKSERKRKRKRKMNCMKGKESKEER